MIEKSDQPPPRPFSVGILLGRQEAEFPCGLANQRVSQDECTPGTRREECGLTRRFVVRDMNGQERTRKRVSVPEDEIRLEIQERGIQLVDADSSVQQITALSACSDVIFVGDEDGARSTQSQH